MSELSADAKALIERARLDEGPDPDAKQRIRARLAAQLGAGALAGGVIASATAPAARKGGALLKSTPLRWLAGTVAAGSLAVAGFLLSAPPERATPNHVTSHAEQPDVAAPAIAPAPSEPPAAPPRAEPPPQVEPRPAAPAPRRRSRAPAPSFAPIGNSGSMSAEIALLARAQKALRARDGKEALRFARQHAENFPSGALYEERVGIEAIAHCVLGERSHPSVRAFLARAPRSPLSARVKKECGVP